MTAFYTVQVHNPAQPQLVGYACDEYGSITMRPEAAAVLSLTQALEVAHTLEDILDEYAMPYVGVSILFQEAH